MRQCKHCGKSLSIWKDDLFGATCEECKNKLPSLRWLPTAPPRSRLSLPAKADTKSDTIKLSRRKGRVIRSCLIGLLILAVCISWFLAHEFAMEKRSRCIHRLLYLGRALAVYSSTHNGNYPRSWIDASKEIADHIYADYTSNDRGQLLDLKETADPAILICPGDRTHSPAHSWDQLTASNISYEYFANGAKLDYNGRLICVCQIHSLSLVTGGLVGPCTTNNGLVKRNGRWYLSSERR